MLGETVRNCVNTPRSGVFTPNGENDREHRLFTNKGSFSLLFDVYTFPAPPAAALRRPVARRYCAARDKAGADMPLCGISAPNGDVLLRANDSEPCLAAMDLLSLLIIFFERRAAPQSGAARLSGDVFAFKIKPFYLSAFVFLFFSPLRPRT